MIHQMHTDLDEADSQDQVYHTKSPSRKLMCVMMTHNENEDHDAGSDKFPTRLWLDTSADTRKAALLQIWEGVYSILCCHNS